jgi:hypothetical protein
MCAYVGGFAGDDEDGEAGGFVEVENVHYIEAGDGDALQHDELQMFGEPAVRDHRDPCLRHRGRRRGGFLNGRRCRGGNWRR